MFWPGSEAPISGIRPTHWHEFDNSVPNAVRVKQVLDWLALPPSEQPAFLTVYFSDVDLAGHEYGPNSVQVFEAAARVDRSLGELVRGIETLGLQNRLTIVVVSDHGMAELRQDRT